MITLKVPSVEQKFDVLVPDFLPVKDVIPLMAEAVSELTRMMYVSSGAEVLCRDDPSEIFNGEYTLRRITGWRTVNIYFNINITE